MKAYAVYSGDLFLIATPTQRGTVELFNECFADKIDGWLDKPKKMPNGRVITCKEVEIS